MKFSASALVPRILILLIGIVLIVAYLLMLVVVASGLPASWIGLILVIVGLSGGIACIVFFFRQTRLCTFFLGLGAIQSVFLLLGHMLAGG